MYSIGEIVKNNHKDTRDEANRKIANYSVQAHGDVWIRFEGRLKIIEAGEPADTFLASVRGFNPGQLRVAISKCYTQTHA